MYQSKISEITLHRYQWEAFNAPSRFVALVSGIQGGKTFLGSLWLGTRALLDPDSNHLIGFPTYKIGLQSTIPKFFEMFPHLKRYWNKASGEIPIPGGKGTIFIRSTENPVTLEGMTIASAWLDEAGQMKADTWIMVQARTAIKQGKVLFTTTPYNMGWLFTEIYRRWKEGDTDYTVVQYTSVDNPYFPKEEFERAAHSMDARVFAMRYLGKFEKMEGLVYQDFTEFNIEKPQQIQAETILGGIDWGYRKPAGILIIKVDVNGVYHIVDEFYGTQKTTPELIEIAKQMADKHKVNKWYADAAEPDRIEEFNRSGFYVLPGVKDLQNGINKIRQLIKERKLMVQSNCISLLDEFANYHYEQSEMGKEEAEKPVKEYDHLLDALRYVISSYHHEKNFFAKRKKKWFNKVDRKYDEITGRLLS